MMLVLLRPFRNGGDAYEMSSITKSFLSPPHSYKYWKNLAPIFGYALLILAGISHALTYTGDAVVRKKAILEVRKFME